MEEVSNEVTRSQVERYDRFSDRHIEFLRREHELLLQRLDRGEITREQYINQLVQRDLSKEEQIKRDKLTGLRNYDGLIEDLKEKFETFESEGQEERRSYPNKDGVLMFLDGDGLKVINDTFNHEVGNIAIVKLAEPLKRKLRRGDIKARFGGDEFVVFIPNISLERGILIAKRLQEAVPQFNREDVKREGDIPKLSFTVGLAQYVKGCTPEQLINEGDLTLYDAKMAGRGSIGVHATDGVTQSRLKTFLGNNQISGVNIFSEHSLQAKTK